MTDLSVLVGSPNGDGKRQVTYKLGEREYPDRIDVSVGWQREQSLKRALESLGLPAENLPALGAEVVRLASEADKKAEHAEDRKPRFVSISSKELDATDYEPTPIITESLFRGIPAIIGAPFKTCKSLVAIDAAISIATGLPFLGSFTVQTPMAVEYFGGEGGPSTAQDYGRRIAASKGITLSDATQVRWCFSVPRLEDVADVCAFCKEIDESGAEVVFLDNLMLCLSGDDAGNVYKMGGILGNVIRLCSERNVTPIFIHHFKRQRVTADPYAPGELSDLTQAGAAEIAGQWWLLTRRESYNPEFPGNHKLWLSIGGRIGQSSLHAIDAEEGRRTDLDGRRWEVTVRAPNEVRNEQDESVEAAKREKQSAKRIIEIEADRKEIVQAAIKLTLPETKNGLRDRVAIPHKRFPAAFASLVADGTLQSAEIKKSNGQTYDGWRLRDEEN